MFAVYTHDGYVNMVLAPAGVCLTLEEYIYLWYRYTIIPEPPYTNVEFSTIYVVTRIVLLCRYFIYIMLYMIVVLPVPSIFRPKFGTINLCGWLRKALEVNTTVVGSL